MSEFDGIYKLPVAVVPTNRTIARADNPDVVFRWVGVRHCSELCFVHHQALCVSVFGGGVGVDGQCEGGVCVRVM